MILKLGPYVIKLVNEPAPNLSNKKIEVKKA